MHCKSVAREWIDAAVFAVVAATLIRAFVFEAYGLRPNTKHDFYFDGTLNNSACQPYGKNRGDNIISDGNGYAKFTFYYSSGITIVDSYSALQAALNNVVGDKKCELVSTEYVPGVKAYNGAYSYSSFTIQILSGL